MTDVKTIDRPLPGVGYAGDVSPLQAWAVLNEQPHAVLVDVRTDAEWQYVGTTDLTSIDKEPVFVDWQVFPHMKVNEDFVTELADLELQPEQVLLFICRSGVRSRLAARAMTAAGYSRCYNVAEGFEGDKNEASKRGLSNGWKFHGLPWKQS